MANYSTSQDLVQDILFRGYELSDGSSDYNDAALRYLNRAYQALWMGGTEFEPALRVDWWWLRTDGALVLEPLITTGTLNVAEDSSMVTFSSAPTDSVEGWFLKIESKPDVYRIESHIAADPVATLDTVYTAENDAAASYKLLHLDYELASDILKPMSPMRSHREPSLNITGCDMDEMTVEFPLSRVALGTPQRFAPVSETAIRFSHYVDALLRIDYTYLRKPADLTNDAASVPLVPHQYRHVLADMALFFLHTDKEDSKAEGIGLQARSGIKAMERENRSRWAEIGEPGRIYTRQGGLYGTRGRGRGTLRTESGAILG